MSDSSAFPRELIQQLTEFRPACAIILGSGLGHLSSQLELSCRIPYPQIKGLPEATVPGHRGELLLGTLSGRRVLLFNGRFHVYQGLTPYQATAPVRLAANCGCRNLLLTCAVGGMADGLKVGDFVLVTDHINFSGLSPLQGLTPPRFVDLQNCYRHEFFAKLMSVAERYNHSLHQGVLAYMVGPQYETPAEITALKIMGAAAVGMSAVQEAIMARSCRMDVATLALVTNLAAGCAPETLNHQDVLRVSEEVSELFPFLVEELLANLV